MRWPFALVLFAGLVSACSVRLVPTEADRVTTNQCKTNGDCGADAQCSNGSCFATKGSLDQVLLEVVPDATSFSAPSLSFFSAQTGLSKGSRHADITLNAASFSAKIQVDASSLPVGCPALATKSTSIEGVVQFAPTGTSNFPSDGLAVAPISVNVALHPTSPQMATEPFGTVTLPPGTYDVYVQPKSSIPCALPPWMLRGVEVTADGDQSAPPGTLALPAPVEVTGSVKRDSPNQEETLAGWQIDLIEPQEGRSISTSLTWPMGSPIYKSNFSILYLPVSVPNGSTSFTGNSANSSPILRLRPPASMAGRAPTVYWSLSAADLDGNSSVDLNLSGVPTSDQLVTITGHVLGDSIGVPGTVQFVSTTLSGNMGLTASFNQSAMTDANGAYSTALFPGKYLIVAASTAGGGSAPSPWAITSQVLTVAPGSTQAVDVPLSPKRIVKGVVAAGRGSTPALGSVVQAVPAILPDWFGVWRSALAQTPIVPSGANVPVSQQDGSFSLPLDPGTFDLSVQAADGSNFASWVWPRVEVDASTPTSNLMPELPYPVPVEGNLDDGTHPLANAAIRAYAKVPGASAVAKVGDARTDSSGHYLLLLPPGFGLPPGP